ncbi:equilibrative nucleoside transporter 3-like [Uranotaenia lowii]|uniref:equilibrative nucleoside transporter 3-like n=1 Tax=Uranotaenia lowii TaxID=190385 RepID=UPI002479F068|nr:equilibrative nucleoside transporter 3-like [Uranotaenia lowii]
MENNKAPEDKYSFNYWSFYLLGMITMLPWCFFLAAEQYWQFKFRDVSGGNFTVANQTQLQIRFQSNLAVTASVPTTICLILHACFGYFIPLQLRIVGTQTMMILTLMITSILTQVDTDSWQNEFFWITMACAFIANASSSTLAGTVFSLAGQFPSRYVSSVVSGQAISGIFISVVTIVTISTGVSAPMVAFFCFSIGTVAICASLTCYFYASRRPFFLYYIALTQTSKRISSIDDRPLRMQNKSWRTTRFIRIFRKVRLFGFALWLAFVVTQAAHPAITLKVVPQQKGTVWTDVYFVPVINYLVFFLSDYVGRLSAEFLEWPATNDVKTCLLAVVRIAFVPAFLACNVQPRGNLPVLIQSDEIFIALIIGFGFGNGYLSNISMIGAPLAVEQPDKEMAAAIMTGFLGVGLACGSILSWITVVIIS